LPAPSNLSSIKEKDEGAKNYLGNKVTAFCFKWIEKNKYEFICGKIAPGMEACFTIKFSPEAKIDY